MNRWQWLLLVLPEMAAGTGAYFLMKYRMNTYSSVFRKCCVSGPLCISIQPASFRSLGEQLI